MTENEAREQTMAYQVGELCAALRAVFLAFAESLGLVALCDWMARRLR